jgi:hypothetical protein
VTRASVTPAGGRNEEQPRRTESKLIATGGIGQAQHFAATRKDIERQVALLEHFGRRIALAVLTSGESPAAGRATEAGIASRILAE